MRVVLQLDIPDEKIIEYHKVMADVLPTLFELGEVTFAYGKMGIHQVAVQPEREASPSDNVDVEALEREILGDPRITAQQRIAEAKKRKANAEKRRDAAQIGGSTPPLVPPNAPRGGVLSGGVFRDESGEVRRAPLKNIPLGPKSPLPKIGPPPKKKEEE